MVYPGVTRVGLREVIPTAGLKHVRLEVRSWPVSKSERLLILVDAQGDVEAV